MLCVHVSMHVYCSVAAALVFTHAWSFMTSALKIGCILKGWHCELSCDKTPVHKRIPSSSSLLVSGLTEAWTRRNDRFGEASWAYLEMAPSVTTTCNDRADSSLEKRGWQFDSTHVNFCVHWPFCQWLINTWQRPRDSCKEQQDNMMSWRLSNYSLWCTKLAHPQIQFALRN